MEDTKIQWATHTWNPWIGCTKVSAGCENCYAEADMDKRRGRVKWGPNGARSKTSDDYWKKPLKWNKDAAFENARRIGPTDRPRVFCASLCDVFEEWGDPITSADGPMKMNDLRIGLFDLIYKTPYLDWLILTKRPENIKPMIYDALSTDIPEPHILEIEPFSKVFPNVWLGTSVENQEQADKRIPELLKVPDAAVRFLSCEPLLDLIDITQWLPELDWVICGGESGWNARPCSMEHIQDIVRQCEDAGVPCFVKQLGSHPVVENGCTVNLNHPKGGDPAEWPEDLRVREFPNRKEG